MVWTQKMEHQKKLKHSLNYVIPSLRMLATVYFLSANCLAKIVCPLLAHIRAETMLAWYPFKIRIVSCPVNSVTSEILTLQLDLSPEQHSTARGRSKAKKLSHGGPVAPSMIVSYKWGPCNSRGRYL